MLQECCPTPPRSPTCRCSARRSAPTSNARVGPVRRPGGAGRRAGRAGAGPTPSSTPTSTALALGLLARGIAKGDRVGIWAPNCAEWVLVQYATAKIGAILVNINPAYRTPRARVRAAPVRHRGCWSAPAAFKTSDYRGDGRRGPAGLPALRDVVYLGSTRVGRPAGRRGGVTPADAGRARGRRWPSTTRSTSSTPRAPPASPRARRCRTTTSSTTATSSASCAATPSRTGSACRCRSTTASAW